MPASIQASAPVSQTAPTVLELRKITKHYPQQVRPAVDQVDLRLHRGELLALLGPSGCGKTTLLRTIAGFEAPQSGLIELDGQTVCRDRTAIPPERRDVGIVFQDYALFPHLCVRDNVAFGLKHLRRHRRLGKEQMQTFTQDAIELVNLGGLEHRYPHELSGGQQQRVALARALAPRPSLVLLDEPFSNLDVQVRLYLRQEVRRILKEVGASGIFVTHDQEEALSIADQVAVMRQGRLEQLGSPEKIYGQPGSKFIAEFVTQANFLDTYHTDQGWQTPLGIVAAAGPSDSGRGSLMIRQEELRLQLADSPGEGFGENLRESLTICDREFLGREYKYSLRHPGLGVLKARTAQRFDIGAAVQVAIAPGPAGLRVFPAD